MTEGLLYFNKPVFKSFASTVDDLKFTFTILKNGTSKIDVQLETIGTKRENNFTKEELTFYNIPYEELIVYLEGKIGTVDFLTKYLMYNYRTVNHTGCTDTFKIDNYLHYFSNNPIKINENKLIELQKF